MIESDGLVESLVPAALPDAFEGRESYHLASGPASRIFQERNVPQCLVKMEHAGPARVCVPKRTDRQVD